MNGLVSLRSLRSGQVAEICQVAGSLQLIHRLEEMGLRPGARLEMVRGGSPCILRIGGTTLSLRHDALLSVLVRPRKSA